MVGTGEDRRLLTRRNWIELCWLLEAGTGVDLGRLGICHRKNWQLVHQFITGKHKLN